MIPKGAKQTFSPGRITKLDSMNKTMEVLVLQTSHGCCGRRDQLRFLQFLCRDRFLDGLKEQLTETQVGQAFFLVTGLPPFLKLRELRAGTLGGLTFGCKNMKFITLWVIGSLLVLSWGCPG